VGSGRFTGLRPRDAPAVDELRAGDSDIDVFAADVVWTAELADDGYDAPPETWDELREMASAVMDTTDVPNGFIFQGADYEGGVANMLEHIWSFGGRVLTTQASVTGQFGESVMNPNVIVIDSARTAEGLDHAHQLIEDGITPEDVTTYREVETDQAFADGDAVFLRSWPLAVAIATEGGLDLDQVGAAPLPVARPGDPSFSTLGGWNLMIAADSPHEAAAWEFIRYMADAEQQRIRARDGAFLPTLESLYDDQELLDAQPVLAVGREAVENARVRPVSPLYSELSPLLASGFQAALLGEEEDAALAAQLQRELEDLVAS
jgi:multiple sugar transport system substrate-binding protein